jgi:hypothetical protein
MVWIEVDKKIPPEGMTILLWCQAEETFIGYYEEGSFLTYELSRPISATHWAYLPEGPQ